MAHIVCVDYCFYEHRHYICREGTPLQTQGLPDALFAERENGGQQVMFSGIFMSYL